MLKEGVRGGLVQVYTLPVKHAFPPLAAAALALDVLAGCAAPKVWITVVPRFDSRAISTVAVLPFENRSDDPDAGKVAAEKLARLLDQRSAWRVITWRDLGPDAADDLFPGGKLDFARATALARAHGADAVLTGAVLQYGSDQSHEVRLANVPFHDVSALQGGQAFDDEPIDWYQLDAAAEFSVALLDAADGRALWTDSRTGPASDRGAPPRLTGAELLDRAADAAARKLLLGFVPHRESVQLPPGCLVTCADFIDHPVDIRSRFTTGDPALYAVLELGSIFAGKEIVLSLRKPSANSLVREHRFVWDDAQESRAFRQETAALADEAGYGRYRVACAVEGREIARADFTLEPAP